MLNAARIPVRELIEKELPRRKTVPPKKLTLEIIKKCLNKCVYCSAFVSSKDAKKIMTFDKAKSVIDQFVGMGGIELNLSGGEPLLHPYLFDIANHAKLQGLRVGLFTCGIFSTKTPTRNEQTAVIKKILGVGFDNIEMTLHAPDSELHDSITNVAGSFKMTYRFVKELSSKTNHLEINFVPMQINADEFEEIVKLVVDLDIHKLNILRFMSQGRGKKNKKWLCLTNVQMARFNKAALQMTKKCANLKITIGHPSDFTFLFDKQHTPNPCSAGIDQCMIKVDGYVIPCPAFGGLPKWIAGNVFSDQLDHIWNESQAFIKLREFIPQNLQGKCRTCCYLQLCKGRCPAERIRENGDLYIGPDPGCPYTHT